MLMPQCSVREHMRRKHLRKLPRKSTNVRSASQDAAPLTGTCCLFDNCVTLNCSTTETSFEQKLALTCSICSPQTHIYKQWSLPTHPKTIFPLQLGFKVPETDSKRSRRKPLLHLLSVRMNCSGHKHRWCS